MDRKKKEAIASLRRDTVNNICELLSASIVVKLDSKQTKSLILCGYDRAKASGMMVFDLVSLVIASFNAMVLTVRDLIPKLYMVM